MTKPILTRLAEYSEFATSNYEEKRMTGFTEQLAVRVREALGDSNDSIRPVVTCVAELKREHDRLQGRYEDISAEKEALEFLCESRREEIEKLLHALRSAKEVLDIAADHGLYQAGSIGEADLNECARLVNEALDPERR